MLCLKKYVHCCIFEQREDLESVFSLMFLYCIVKYFNAVENIFAYESVLHELLLIKYIFGEEISLITWVF